MAPHTAGGTTAAGNSATARLRRGARRLRWSQRCASRRSALDSNTRAASLLTASSHVGEETWQASSERARSWCKPRRDTSLSRSNLETLPMSRVVVRSLVAVVSLVVARTSPLAAQNAVTISGHVTASGMPLTGARVRITELGLERVTDDAGRYSFVVPSADVRGQT